MLVRKMCSQHHIREDALPRYSLHLPEIMTADREQQRVFLFDRPTEIPF